MVQISHRHSVYISKFKHKKQYKNGIKNEVPFLLHPVQLSPQVLPEYLPRGRLWDGRDKLEPALQPLLVHHLGGDVGDELGKKHEQASPPKKKLVNHSYNRNEMTDSNLSPAQCVHFNIPINSSIRNSIKTIQKSLTFTPPHRALSSGPSWVSSPRATLGWPRQTWARPPGACSPQPRRQRRRWAVEKNDLIRPT